MSVDITIPSLGVYFQDYRMGIAGDSFNWQFKLKATDIDYFVIHHSVTPQTAKLDGNWKREADYIANLHIEKRGWGGIGYRFVICSDGTVAYVGDCGASGSSVLNNNDHILSACFVGNFTAELPTAMQVWSAHRLANWFLNEQSSWANLKGWDKMIGHKETHNHPDFKQPANPTACPSSAWKVAGDNLYTRIKNDNWQGYPDPQPPIVIPPDPIPPVDDCEQRITDAVNKSVEDCKKTIDKNNQDWEVKLEQDIETAVKEALDKDGWTWQQHFKEAYRKFFNRK